MEKEKMVEVKMPDIPSSAENTLKTIATIILICGIIVSVILLFTAMFIEEPSYSYHTEKVFNPEGFVMTVGVLLSSIATWASLNVFANISLRLKGIQETMPLRLVEAQTVLPTNIQQEEEKTERKGVSTLKVGDKVVYRKTMAICKVEEIGDGKVLLYAGLLGGHKWIPEDELIIPQE